MRPYYRNLTGQVDKDGNATITVRFEQTGEWHDVKFALSTTAAAEWAILINGRPATYGRGRRVTLGPELIQDGEVVAVSVTGGPPLAQIDGSCTGKSGDPTMIVAGFTPSPNTIALDTASPQVVLGAVSAAANASSGTINFVLPPGAQAVGAIVYSTGGNGIPGLVQFIGHVTGAAYILTTSPTNAGVIPALISATDTSIDVSINGAAAAPSKIDVVCWFGFPAVGVDDFGIGALSVTSVGVPPALWQAPTAIATINVTLTPGSVAHVIPGTPGQTIYLFGLRYSHQSTAVTNGTIQDTTGSIIDTWDQANMLTPGGVNLGGAPLPAGPGAGLDIKNTGSNNMHSMIGIVSYSKG